jgi:hypothetical protein
MTEITELKNLVLDGESNALAAYVALKEFERELADALKAVKPLALDEAESFGEKTFDAYGAKISVKNGPGTWKYDGIHQYTVAKATLKSIEDLAKKAYEAKKAGMTVVDAHGEIIQPAEYKEGETTISITLNK